MVFTIRRNNRNVKQWHKKSLLICMISALDCIGNGVLEISIISFLLKICNNPKLLNINQASYKEEYIGLILITAKGNNSSKINENANNILVGGQYMNYFLLNILIYILEI